jgi:hypothetical protein
MINWRNCQASLSLIAEVNQRWPNRDKTSDGTIGDVAHQNEGSSSDHNPWIVVSGVGVVRARDIDSDGIDAAWLAEYLRQLGAHGDPRLNNYGYIIFNRKITSPDFSTWQVYNGIDPHTSHIHISFSRLQSGFDSNVPWGITTSIIVPSEDDLTPDQAAALDEVVRTVRNINAQIFVGENKPNQPGWPTWQGGTNETLTLVDYLRRNNTRVETIISMLSQSGAVNPQAVADAVIKELGSMVYDAVIQALGKDNTAKAQEIVSLIGNKLSTKGV